MSIPEDIMQEIAALSDVQKREVLDFAKFLRIKEEVAIDAAMDAIIEQNLQAFKELAK